MDPITMASPAAVATAHLAGEFLCGMAPPNKLTPVLAEKWEAKAPDDWVFTIRQGVMFQDGSPLTTDDVVASFQRLSDPKGTSAALSTFKGILGPDGIEKMSPTEVRFHLDRPFVDFPYLVSTYNYNTVILPKDYEPGSYIKGKVGTGPFVIQSFEPNRKVVATKNPNYWQKGKPYLDGWEINFYEDPDSAVVQMQGGAVDAYGQIPFSGAQTLQGASGVKIVSTPSSAYRGIHMRVDTDPFKDKRVRQAIALCIDRPAVIKALFGGEGDVGNDHGFAPIFGFVPPESEVPQRAADIEQARQLLTDAGHPDGIQVTLTTENNVEIPDYVTNVQAMCKPAGIDIKLDIQPLATYFGSGDNQPWLEVPFGCVEWGARGTAGQLIAPAYSCDGVWNAAQWCNKDYSRLVTEFDGELDEQKRTTIAASAAKIQNDETPGIIAYWLPTMSAMSEKVQDYNTIQQYPNGSGVWLKS
jgi:peptide/nickel transport system substrate-binding protein